MNKVYLSLGSNLGDRNMHLQNCMALLTEQAGEIIKASSVYETEPWKMENANGFLNQVILLDTRLTAHDLMDTLLDIENQMGRVRTSTSNNTHYESRVIDIDILLYNNSIIATEKITIPHPLLHLRKFVLEPFSELDENQVHPILNKSIKTILAECRDVYEVERSMSK